jgi:hypothetical protein
MQTASSDENASAELAALLKRAGLQVPDDRMEAVLAGYVDLKTMCALLRQPRTAAAEPSNTYSLVTLMKGQ